MTTATPIDLDRFAAEWIAGWNARDLERVLSHYAPDVELVTPRAAVVVPASGGLIRGIEALRAYWSAALARSPDLQFTLDAVMATVDGATLLYRNHRRERVAETFLWNPAGLVVRSVVAYAPPPRGALYCAVARVPLAGVDAFARYEDAVLALLPEHGATLERRLRTIDGTTEVHLLRFGDGALDAYRADPRRAAHRPALEASGATVELLAVDEA
jgi:ketosteroid isomerase-like protein